MLSKEMNGNVATITASIKPYAQTFATDLRYHLVITEDSLVYAGSNGILVHPFVMRVMAAGGLGEPITIQKDQPQTVTKQVALNPLWVREKMHAIAFVQSNGTRYVLQTAKINLK